MGGPGAPERPPGPQQPEEDTAHTAPGRGDGTVLSLPSATSFLWASRGPRGKARPRHRTPAPSPAGSRAEPAPNPGPRTACPAKASPRSLAGGAPRHCERGSRSHPDTRQPICVMRQVTGCAIGPRIVVRFSFRARSVPLTVRENSCSPGSLASQPLKSVG